MKGRPALIEFLRRLGDAPPGAHLHHGPCWTSNHGWLVTIAIDADNGQFAALTLTGRDTRKLADLFEKHACRLHAAQDAEAQWGLAQAKELRALAQQVKALNAGGFTPWTLSEPPAGAVH